MNQRIMLVVGVAMLPALVAFADFMGTTTTRQYRVQNGQVSYTGETVSNNDNGTIWNAEMCWGNGCRPCGNCHKNGTDRSKEVYTVAKHDKLYFPTATVKLAEGQKLPLGDRGVLGALVLRNGQILYYRPDGRLNLVSPLGSGILRDRTGPFLLRMPSPPTLR